MLPAYDACMFICPWRVRGKNMRRSKGNRGCLFQGCSTVVLADRCNPVQKNKNKNLLTGIISPL